MLVQSYSKMDFRSLRMPRECDEKSGGIEISCKRLCEIVRHQLGWEGMYSYRIPGRTYQNQGVAAFDLAHAERIDL